MKGRRGLGYVRMRRLWTEENARAVAPVKGRFAWGTMGWEGHAKFCCIYGSIGRMVGDGILRNPHIFKIYGWGMGLGSREETQSVRPDKKAGIDTNLMRRNFVSISR